MRRHYGWRAVPDNDSPDTATTVRPDGQARQVVCGRYELVRLIASGGMAEVWEARDRVLGRPVAVKLLHRHLASDDAFTQRFRAEALAAARLHHPSIVAVYDTCTDEGQEAIVMELVRGRTLRQYLDEQGRLDPDEVVQIGADVAAALSAAHRARIVHRDIKPANILLCDDARVMVTDFGIAKVRDDTDITRAGTMLGTVKYLAPEQVESRPVDARTDVYGLGAVLYECLVGRPPFTAETAAATALARLHQAPVPPRALRPDVPENLDAAVMRALARDPARRFATADDLRSALLAPPTPPGHAPRATDPTLVTTPVPVGDPTTWGPPPPPPASAFPTTAAAPPRVATPPLGPPALPSRRSSSWRDWVLPAVLVLLIGGSIGLAVALVARTQGSDSSRGVAPSGTPVAVVDAASFDPFGDGREHDSEIGLVVDGNRATAWRTETYSSREFGGIKPGVGLVLSFDARQPLDTLTVESTTSGWSAQIFVADGSPSTLDGWGEPVAEATIDGGYTFDLGGARGSSVLVWITRLGEPPYRVELHTVTARA